MAQTSSASSSILPARLFWSTTTKHKADDARIFFVFVTFDKSPTSYFICSSQIVASTVAVLVASSEGDSSNSDHVGCCHDVSSSFILTITSTTAALTITTTTKMIVFFSATWKLQRTDVLCLAEAMRLQPTDLPAYS